MTVGKLARRVIVAGIPVAALTNAELAEQMVADCMANRSRTARPLFMSSINGQTISSYTTDPEFKKSFDQADVLSPDGMSVVFASRILAPNPLPERVATTDFVHLAAEAATRAGLKFYFLGATDEVNAKAVEQMKRQYPDLQICGRHHGYFDQSEEPELMRKIVESGADVLWVGLGVPREHHFIARNRDRLRGVTWIKSCGGLYKFLSGADPRAPLWMQNTGLEWAFRCAIRPTQFFWRYLITNPHAIYLICKHRALTKSSELSSTTFAWPELV